jgi:hypothetical protein
LAANSEKNVSVLNFFFGKNFHRAQKELNLKANADDNRE